MILPSGNEFASSLSLQDEVPKASKVSDFGLRAEIFVLVWPWKCDKINYDGKSHNKIKQNVPW